MSTRKKSVIFKGMIGFVLVFWCMHAFSLPVCADHKDDSPTNKGNGQCVSPPFLKPGDKVALISPAYATSMENVENTVKVLQGWGWTPVVGPNVGKVYAGKYSGTVEERVADIRWALDNPDVKAIICNRGGYGTIQYVNELTLQELASHPKWIVGFSDITTLHGLQTCAGVMSIHGTMSSFLGPSGGRDATSTLMRDILMGIIPRYEVPAHPCNITGRARGMLVGGNICTFAPLLGSQADATAFDDIILFIEEVEESMHNLDRLFNMLQLNGVLARCKGVVLGEFTGCRADLEYESVEYLYRQYLEKYNIPVLCGFPAGHGDVNLPLIMGAPVTLDVRADGATLTFDIIGEQRTIRTETILPADTSK
ncbi:MAG: LD-carboxypeptidase [Prevotella sp.]|nr:LD-carboxypeptidase [Prevotella sp.]